MALLTFTLTVGAQTATRAVDPTDTRAIEFLDDLIAHYYNENPPLTRAQAGQKYVNEVVEETRKLAKRLKQERLDSAVPEADSL